MIRRRLVRLLSPGTLTAFGKVLGWPVHVIGEGVYLRTSTGVHLVEEDEETTVLA